MRGYISHVMETVLARSTLVDGGSAPKCAYIFAAGFKKKEEQKHIGAFAASPLGMLPPDCCPILQGLLFVHQVNSAAPWQYTLAESLATASMLPGSDGVVRTQHVTRTNEDKPTQGKCTAFSSNSDLKLPVSLVVWGSSASNKSPARQMVADALEGVALVLENQLNDAPRRVALIYDVNRSPILNLHNRGTTWQAKVAFLGATAGHRGHESIDEGSSHWSKLAAKTSGGANENLAFFKATIEGNVPPDLTKGGKSARSLSRVAWSSTSWLQFAKASDKASLQREGDGSVDKLGEFAAPNLEGRDPVEFLNGPLDDEGQPINMPKSLVQTFETRSFGECWKAYLNHASDVNRQLGLVDKYDRGTAKPDTPAAEIPMHVRSVSEKAATFKPPRPDVVDKLVSLLPDDPADDPSWRKSASLLLVPSRDLAGLSSQLSSLPGPSDAMHYVEDSDHVRVHVVKAYEMVAAHVLKEAQAALQRPAPKSLREAEALYSDYTDYCRQRNTSVLPFKEEGPRLEEFALAATLKSINRAATSAPEVPAKDAQFAWLQQTQPSAKLLGFKLHAERRQQRAYSTGAVAAQQTAQTMLQPSKWAKLLFCAAFLTISDFNIHVEETYVPNRKGPKDAPLQAPLSEWTYREEQVFLSTAAVEELVALNANIDLVIRHLEDKSFDANMYKKIIMLAWRLTGGLHLLEHGLCYPAAQLWTQEYDVALMRINSRDAGFGDGLKLLLDCMNYIHRDLVPDLHTARAPTAVGAACLSLHGLMVHGLSAGKDVGALTSMYVTPPDPSAPLPSAAAPHDQPMATTGRPNKRARSGQVSSQPHTQQAAPPLTADELKLLVQAGVQELITKAQDGKLDPVELWRMLATGTTNVSRLGHWSLDFYHMLLPVETLPKEVQDFYRTMAVEWRGQDESHAANEAACVAATSTAASNAPPAVQTAAGASALPAAPSAASATAPSAAGSELHPGDSVAASKKPRLYVLNPAFANLVLLHYFSCPARGVSSFPLTIKSSDWKQKSGQTNLGAYSTVIDIDKYIRELQDKAANTENSQLYTVNGKGPAHNNQYRRNELWAKVRIAALALASLGAPPWTTQMLTGTNVHAPLLEHAVSWPSLGELFKDDIGENRFTFVKRSKTALEDAGIDVAQMLQKLTPPACALGTPITPQTWFPGAQGSASASDAQAQLMG